MDNYLAFAETSKGIEQLSSILLQTDNTIHSPKCILEESIEINVIVICSQDLGITLSRTARSSSGAVFHSFVKPIVVHRNHALKLGFRESNEKAYINEEEH